MPPLRVSSSCLKRTRLNANTFDYRNPPGRDPGVRIQTDVLEKRPPAEGGSLGAQDEFFKVQSWWEVHYPCWCPVLTQEAR
jgi:hypothetical protein